MMRFSILSIFALSLLTVAGCAAKKSVKPVSGLQLVIQSSEACPVKVVLTGCDVNNPPRCKQSKVDYPSGCEQIVMTK